jgi:hypothetical protein
VVPISQTSPLLNLLIFTKDFIVCSRPKIKAISRVRECQIHRTQVVHSLMATRLAPSRWVGSPLSSGDKAIHFVGFSARFSVKKHGFVTLNGSNSESKIFAMQYDTIPISLVCIVAIPAIHYAYDTQVRYVSLSL